jgi:hypothetical protein
MLLIPLFYFCFCLFSKFLSYKARECTIDQCARIFKENEHMVKSAVSSVFNLVDRTEQHYYQYYYFSSIANGVQAIIGKTFSPFMNLFRKYLTTRNRTSLCERCPAMPTSLFCPPQMPCVDRPMDQFCSRNPCVMPRVDRPMDQFCSRTPCAPPRVDRPMYQYHNPRAMPTSFGYCPDCPENSRPVPLYQNHTPIRQCAKSSPCRPVTCGPATPDFTFDNCEQKYEPLPTSDFTLNNCGKKSNCRPVTPDFTLNDCGKKSNCRPVTPDFSLNCGKSNDNAGEDYLTRIHLNLPPYNKMERSEAIKAIRRHCNFPNSSTPKSWTGLGCDETTLPTGVGCNESTLPTVTGCSVGPGCRPLCSDGKIHMFPKRIPNGLGGSCCVGGSDRGCDNQPETSTKNNYASNFGNTLMPALSNLFSSFVTPNNSGQNNSSTDYSKYINSFMDVFNTGACNNTSSQKYTNSLGDESEDEDIRVCAKNVCSPSNLCDFETCRMMLNIAKSYDNSTNPSVLDFSRMTISEAMLSMVRLSSELGINTHIQNGTYLQLLDTSFFNTPNQKVADFLRLLCFVSVGREQFNSMNNCCSKSVTTCNNGDEREFKENNNVCEFKENNNVCAENNDTCLGNLSDCLNNFGDYKYESESDSSDSSDENEIENYNRECVVNLNDASNCNTSNCDAANCDTTNCDTVNCSTDDISTMETSDVIVCENC